MVSNNILLPKSVHEMLGEAGCAEDAMGLVKLKTKYSNLRWIVNSIQSWDKWTGRK